VPPWQSPAPAAFGASTVKTTKPESYFLRQRTVITAHFHSPARRRSCTHLRSPTLRWAGQSPVLQVGSAAAPTVRGAFRSEQVSPGVPRQNTNFRFTGWSGACSGTAACTVAMNADSAVTATFQPQLHATIHFGTHVSSCTFLQCQPRHGCTEVRDSDVRQWQRRPPPTPTRPPTLALSDLLQRSPPHARS
jgi:hypothetical protein